ncbi:unnamed protein product [Sympodiomycopsis kandeliae]
MADSSDTWRTGHAQSSSGPSSEAPSSSKGARGGKSRGGAPSSAMGQNPRRRGGPSSNAIKSQRYSTTSGSSSSGILPATPSSDSPASLPSSSSRPNKPSSSKQSSQQQSSKKKLTKAQAELERLPLLPGAPHSMEYLTNAMYSMTLASGKVKPAWVENPRNPLQAYFTRRFGESPEFQRQVGRLEAATEKSYRVIVEADREFGISGYGDGKNAKDAERSAAFDALMQLAERGLLDAKANPIQEAEAPVAAQKSQEHQATLSSGINITAERAREFMDFYCQEFKFGKPIIEYSQAATGGRGRNKKGGGKSAQWQADCHVGNMSVAQGLGSNKKAATQNCYVNAVVFIEQSDPELYARFDHTHRPGASITAAAHVNFRISEQVNEDIREVVSNSRRSLLYSKRPQRAGLLQPGDGRIEGAAPQQTQRAQQIRRPAPHFLESKSRELLSRLESYQTDDRVADMRNFRQILPVTQNITDILTKVALHQVSICMAATGSGKSTQVPQILLDDAILEGKGAECNVICTQPRRIAAISLAQRVAQERGESVGQSVGYQVRFEQNLPQQHGSITFCTTGSFMRRLQNALGDTSADSFTWLDTVTHVVIDEVHERDVQTDLLLVVLKKVLDQRRAAGKRDVKLILMSATVDPKLFQNYFPDHHGRPAPVVEIPGRAFPVERHFMEQTVPLLKSHNLPLRAGGWVWQQKNVQDYVHRELAMRGGMKVGEEGADVIDDLEIPYPLVALYVADALAGSDDGHILVFLPGWDEIKAVLGILQDPYQFPLMGLNFNDRNRFEIHILHSTVPVADQQAVFSPPPKGVRRIILSTNIAETSVTIPDVTVVIDTGRVKEMRYDPSRHLSSLVSAWVGTSNLSQRAGRAGRHRPGEYFGLLSKARHDKLAVNQTVEMQRAELTDVVLHIKALNMPGMQPEDVLASAIEPPSPERVQAAMQQLYMIGALDTNKALTSLGSLLLQIPVNAAMGKMILYGLFFRCIEPTVVLAAILTSRDPFLSAIDLKTQVSAVKDSWCPSDYRSDALATLRAYQAWTEIDARGDRSASTRFCSDNYLSKNTLLDIQRLSNHLLQSLSSIIDLILSTSENRETFMQSCHRSRHSSPELNQNSHCTPLLAALIAMASTPNFAIRKGEKTYQTSQDKTTFISPASVCHLKHTKGKEGDAMPTGDRELYAFGEKSRNVSSVGGGGAMTMLRTVTRLDPLTYMVFGSHRIRGTNEGVICDDWLPMRGFFGALDEVEQLKQVMDVCMLRVFEGIGHSKNGPDRRKRNGQQYRRGPQALESSRGDWDDDDGGDEGGSADHASASNGHQAPQAFGDRSDLSLAHREIDEFKYLIDGIVRILEGYAAERASIASSRDSTRPSSPGVGLNLGYSMGPTLSSGRGYHTNSSFGPSNNGHHHANGGRAYSPAPPQQYGSRGAPGQGAGPGMSYHNGHGGAGHGYGHANDSRGPGWGPQAGGSYQAMYQQGEQHHQPFQQQQQHQGGGYGSWRRGGS